MSEFTLSTAPASKVTHAVQKWMSYGLLIIGFSGLAIFSEHKSISVGQPLDELLSYKLTGYANLLLVTSAILYVAYLKRQFRAVAKWATGLATAGMIGLFVALLTRWFETYQVLEEGHIPISDLYEVTVFFTAITVAVYLVMESIYQVRSLGAFIMPISLASVGLQEWLVLEGYGNPSELVPALKSYWLHAHVLANFIGYGAFAIAGGAGILFLVRSRLEKQGRQEGFISSLPSLKIIDDWMYRSIAIGFPVFTLAVILGAGWAYYAWGSYWSWDPKETWSLIVMLVYAGFLHARLIKGWTGIVLAWWAILGFCFTLFCFLGVNLFLSGLHSYGAIN